MKFEFDKFVVDLEKRENQNVHDNQNYSQEEVEYYERLRQRNFNPREHWHNRTNWSK